MFFEYYAVENYNTARDGWSRGGKSIPVRVRIPYYAKEAIHLLSSYTDYIHKQKGAVAGVEEGLEGGEIATFQPNPNRHHPLQKEVNANAS